MTKTLPSLLLLSSILAVAAGLPGSPSIKTAIWLPDVMAAVGPCGPGDEEALAALIQDPKVQANPGLFRDYIAKHPDGCYTPAVALNTALLLKQSGNFGQALAVLKQAWDHDDIKVKGVLGEYHDRIGSELAAMEAGLGQTQALEGMVSSLDKRPMHGSARYARALATAGLRGMRENPADAYSCGGMALERVLATLHPDKQINGIARHPKVGKAGLSLREMEALSVKAGLSMVAGHLALDADVPVPSVVHYKVGHFVAVVGRKKNSFELKDPAFGLDIWVPRQTLDAESDGIYLVLDGLEPVKGWTAVTDAEKDSICGSGTVKHAHKTMMSCPRTQTGTCPFCSPGDGRSGSCGMPTPSFDLQGAAVSMYDTPVKYQPAYGPPLDFTLTYHQTMPGQTTVPSRGGFGPNWSNSWDAQLAGELDSSGTCCDASFQYCSNWAYYTFQLYGRGGGLMASDQAPTFGLQISPAGYLVGCIQSPPYDHVTVSFPSGWQEIYKVSDHLLLSQLVDPQGNAVSLTYEYVGGLQRLHLITAATGEMETLDYDPNNPSEIIAVHSPSGATAHFGYDNQGRLTRLTDVLNLTSTITYDSVTLDQIDAMTTPYGSWSFNYQGDFGTVDMHQVDMVDPAGQQSSVRFDQSGTYGSYPAEPLPTGMNDYADYWEFRNTFYWDPKTLADAGHDPTKAVIYHWNHGGVLNDTLSNLLESIKRPSESRVFFDYPGQGLSYLDYGVTTDLPQDSGRVLDDGTTQREHFEYNSAMQVTRHVDPSGKELDYTYDPGNLIDLLSVRDGSGEVLASFVYGDPNAPHRPKEIYDAGGQETQLTYNSHGQLTSVQLPSGETTALNYLPSGFLSSIVPPAQGTTVNFTPDPANPSRIGSSQDAVNGTLTYDYDALDHLRHVLYPDGTYEEITYDKLDVASTRDRDGRVTHYTHDAAQRLTGVLDPANHLTQLSWCHCGALSALTDADGHTTSWNYDIEGRLTSKVYPDQTQVQYGYENSTSRLHSIVDAMQQQTTFNYNVADQLLGVQYSGAKNATAPVAFQYEPVLGRLSHMQDGTGATSFQYNPIGSGNGAGRLATVSGPLAHSAVQYAYDASGRVVSTGVNGVAETYHYDPTGQLDSLTNPLGTFGYQYDPNKGLLSQVNLPNNVKTVLDYHTDNSELGRLQDITHQGAGQSILAKYSYNYDPAGQITQWTSQLGDGPAKTLGPEYDLAGQLTGTVSTNGTTLGWAYDPAGNRTQSSWNGITTAYTPNNLNQLLQVSPTKMKVAGLTNVTATVTVNGLAAAANGPNGFGVWVPEGNGKQVLTVTAQSGPSSLTQHYQVVNGQTLQYDLNGNLINDGQRQYDWDAANRLIRVSNLFPDASGSIHSSEFSYDGLWRRVEIKEKQGLQTVADRKFVWDGGEIREERDQSNNVAKRFYEGGVQIVTGQGAGAFTYLRDHLGSVKTVLDSSGNVVASYEYDMWGNRTQTAGTFVADQGFTGYFVHQPTGMALTWFRAYMPSLGRWISRDPLEEEGGLNVYGYGDNNPVGNIDPWGLSYFVYDRRSGTITVYNRWGLAVATCSANNNIAGDKPSKWTPGTFETRPDGYQRHDKANSPWGSYGQYGIYIFDVPGCSGCGVHSGRAVPMKDKKGRGGPDYNTHGCIRTEDSCMKAAQELGQSGDPIDRIQVQ